RGAVSPDGRTLAVAYNDQSVLVWDLATRRPLTPKLPHEQGYPHLEFSPDSRRLAVADGTKVRVWEVATAREAFPPLEHPGNVHDMAFSPDGSRLATVTDKPDVRLLDARTGRARSEPR